MVSADDGKRLGEIKMDSLVLHRAAPPVFDGIMVAGDAVALMAGVSGPRSDARIRCGDCIRRLLSVNGNEGAIGEAENRHDQAKRPMDSKE